MKASIRAFVVTFLTVLALYGVAQGRAEARPIEQDFFADLSAQGITIVGGASEAQAVQFAQWTCEGLQLGVGVYVMRDTIQRSQQNFGADGAEIFIEAAVKYFCPEILGPVVKR